MKVEDLKNGMSYKNRNGEMFYIINDKVFVKSDVITLRYCRELYQELVYYDEDFKCSSNKKWDIMEIYDTNNKLIWERKEIDWSKIPIDTKILVRNSQDQQWKQRYFAKYEDKIVYAFENGATSWSVSTWNNIIPCTHTPRSCSIFKCINYFIFIFSKISLFPLLVLRISH